ncbi:MAG: hypothetical protein U5K79_07040 [Cyclobacteriaceae bacterium]|nr:hypothetical protein [Cyclobacteriaceae bacterium]
MKSQGDNAMDQITSKDEIGELTRNFRQMMVKRWINHLAMISEKNKRLEVLLAK